MILDYDGEWTSEVDAFLYGEQSLTACPGFDGDVTRSRDAHMYAVVGRAEIVNGSVAALKYAASIVYGAA